ncbi:hypothetical protein DFAR_1470015 [Desulfarculales bacterium]
MAMLFCYLARANSLREICLGLSCCLGKLPRLGMSAAQKRSTLSYANQHRPSSLFRALFFKAMERFRAQGSLGKKKGKLNFKNKLLSLSSSTITLCLSLFLWAEYKRAKGGVKASHHAGPRRIHVQLCTAYRGQGGRCHRSPGAGPKPWFHTGLEPRLPRLCTVWQVDRPGRLSFVTRLKSNAAFEVMANRPSGPKAQNVLAD